MQYWDISSDTSSWTGAESKGCWPTTNHSKRFFSLPKDWNPVTLLMMAQTFLFTISTNLLICGSDFLYMSCHDNPNIIAYNFNTSKLTTSELLDISKVDWTKSDNLHFRGMAISDNILYVANSKKSASFIGKWQCNQQNTPNFDDNALKFIGNFTGV